MAGFVLVHGAWHGAWCWRDVVPALREAGHGVEAVDLPGHGECGREAGLVSFDEYVETVCAAVQRAPRPLILVGHSLGGMSITQAAERLPDRIDLLVYLCAFLPADGQSVVDLAATDFEDSLVAANQVVDVGAGVAWIDPGGARETLYGTCAEADAEWAEARLVPEGLAPQSQPVRISAARGGRVPRMYIETACDRAIPPRKQRAMVAATPVRQLRTIDSDHSPFLSASDQVIRHLEQAAASTDSSQGHGSQKAQTP